MGVLILIYHMGTEKQKRKAEEPTKRQKKRKAEGRGQETEMKRRKAHNLRWPYCRGETGRSTEPKNAGGIEKPSRNPGCPQGSQGISPTSAGIWMRWKAYFSQSLPIGVSASGHVNPRAGKLWGRGSLDI